jgi:hypothetical protein
LTVHKRQAKISRTTGHLAGLLLSVVVFALLDLLVGVFLLPNDTFRGQPTVPYDLIFTETQAEALERPPGNSAYGRFDADLGWSIRPNGVSSNGLFRANSAGFRALREYSLKPPGDVIRIAAFGDSYTHGDEVSNQDSWPHLLEQGGDLREVLNFGVNGYGTGQALLRYRRDGAQYEPDIVIIEVILGSILRNVSVYRPAFFHDNPNAVVKPRFTLTDSDTLVLVPTPVASEEELLSSIRSRELLSVLKQTDFWVQRAPLAYDRSPLFWSSLLRITYGIFENSGRSVAAYYRDPDSEPFRVSMAILETFYEEAMAMGADRVLVVLFPVRGAIARQLEGRPVFWGSLIEYLDEKNIPYLDLTAAMTEAARSNDLNDLFMRTHYSRAGNEVVARELESILFSQDGN